MRKLLLLSLVALTVFTGLHFSRGFKHVDEVIATPTGPVRIEGKYHKRFKKVYEEFKKNFEERNERGSSFCVTHKGRVVVDLWGGVKNITTNDPWEKDTVSIIWSASKGATAFAINKLIDEGKVKLEDPVSKYWPEFTSNGKDKITVRQILNHTAGLPANKIPLKDGAWADWDYMTDILEQETLWWEPGEKMGYHASTYSWLVGNVIRNVTGKTVNQYFQDEIAGPLGIDFWYGLPESEYDRAAYIEHADLAQATADLFFKAISDPSSLQGAVFFNSGNFTAPGNDRLKIYRDAEVPATNCHTNAYGLAVMYGPLANDGVWEGKRYISKRQIDRMSAASSGGEDMTLLAKNRFGLGFNKGTDNRDERVGRDENIITGEKAFGAPGFGGFWGEANPEAKVSIGYTMLTMGAELWLHPRGQSLVDATYKSVGYKSDESGRWSK